MTKNQKCQAKGGAANCTDPNCPERNAAVTRLYDDFMAQRQKAIGESGMRPIIGVPGYSGDDDGIRRATEYVESKMSMGDLHPLQVVAQAAEAQTATSEVDEDEDEYVPSWERPNPVNTPEKFGMEMFAEVNLPAADYSFYEAAVLKNDQGYWLSTDSGCSCPIPWENHTMDDFTGPLTAEQVAEELQSLHDACDSTDMTDYTRDSVHQTVGLLLSAEFLKEHPETHPSLVTEMFRPGR